MHYALSSVSPENLYRCQILCDIVVRISHRLPRLRHRRSKNHFPSARSQHKVVDFLDEAPALGPSLSERIAPTSGCLFCNFLG